MISKEDALYFLDMRKSEKIRAQKRYYKLLNDLESLEYKKFISVYIANRSLLSDREQLVLDSIYGVNIKPMKLREVAEKVDLTPERIRQILYKGERKIATFLRRSFKIKDF
jgi:DNA-directed RNA polymerase sigma subunit (sigma70/sigma32)